MKISVTDTSVALESGDTTFSILEKPQLPDYSNVTPKPYFISDYTECETIWDRFCSCAEKLPSFCLNDPYLGCYALLFGRLYPLLLSSNQAKNIIAYGPSTDCGAYRVFQDFMTFLHMGNALTALSQSPFSFAAISENSCLSLLYRLDTCPALAAVCDAMEKVRQGGIVLLYTLKDAPPTDLAPLCDQAEKDSFDSCTVYALTMNETLLDFARANSSEIFLSSRVQEILQRVNDVRNPILAMLSGANLPSDVYRLVTLVLQQIEEILLSVYDYLENDELPIQANALKEAVLNLYVGIRGNFDITTYREKLTQSSETFFDAIEREFQ